MWDSSNPERAFYPDWRHFAQQTEEVEKEYQQALEKGKFAGKEEQRKKVEDNLKKCRQEVEDYREAGWTTKSMVEQTRKVLMS